MEGRKTQWRWLLLVLLFVPICFVGEYLFSKSKDVIVPTLINGTPVPDGERPDIVRINTNGSGCTASVVGPRVLLTAAHCGANGATSTFKVAGKTYSGKVRRSPLYPRQDHDVAVIITGEEVKLPDGKSYTSVGGKAEVGKMIKIFGYGCTKPGGGGGNDGILRTGDSKITGFSGFDAVSRLPGGGALCYGDSGGPAYVDENGKSLQLTVNSKGNIKDTNYTTRLDTEESKKFLEDVIAQEKLEICGVNKDCAGGGLPDTKFVLENKVVKVEVTSKGVLELEYIKNTLVQALLHLESQVGGMINPISPSAN